MLLNSTILNTTDYKQYAVWLITALIATIGLRYAKEIIAIVLEKLYEIFIQNHTSIP